MYRFLAGLLVGLAAAVAYFAWPRAAQSIGPAAGTALSQADVRASESRDEAAPAAATVTPGSEVARTSAIDAHASPPRATTLEASKPAPPRMALELPGGRLVTAERGTKSPLDELLRAFRADCQFGAGAGGSWPGGSVFPHTASWQGGLVTFDTIDLAGNKARLKNYSGMTGSQDGELDVRVVSTDTGLHFTVIKPDGELLIASVYAALDSQRKHIGAISFHGANLDHETAQFYGSCVVQGG